MLKSKAHTILGTKEGRLMKIGLRRQTLMGLLVLLALALPMRAVAREQVPFKASETGTFQLLGPCDTTGIALDVTGTGDGTYLGHYSAHYRECFDPATGAVTDGSFTLTAANGDMIFGTYSGHVLPTDDPNVIVFEDPGVITGGTGRFAGVSGVMTASGVANLATGNYTGTLSGGVSSPGVGTS
jgi:hypothetical protein